MSNLETYIVTIERPPGVSVEELEGEIEKNILAMGGYCHPADPMFYIDRETISVRKKKNKVCQQ